MIVPAENCRKPIYLQAKVIMMLAAAKRLLDSNTGVPGSCVRPREQYMPK
jgi:hypothetical protein